MISLIGELDCASTRDRSVNVSHRLCILFKYEMTEIKYPKARFLKARGNRTRAGSNTSKAFYSDWLFATTPYNFIMTVFSAKDHSRSGWVCLLGPRICSLEQTRTSLPGQAAGIEMPLSVGERECILTVLSWRAKVSEHCQGDAPPCLPRGQEVDSVAAAVTGLQAEVDLSQSGNSLYRLLFLAHKHEAALFLEADLAVHALSVCSGSWIP